MQETEVQCLGQEDPLEEEVATHSSILAWRFPWTGRSLAGYSPWGCKESEMTEHAYTVPFDGMSSGHVFVGFFLFLIVSLEFIVALPCCTHFYCTGK